uniref:Apoptosis inhibitor 5 n=1 Tax=Cacopsylla melanoneura TaxID=428564 RepID=A0A8D9AQI4_9HEMI
MSLDKIEILYRNFGVLADAKDKISEHVEEYSEIIGAVKGSVNDKKLASQFITRFFKHFPTLMDQAIEALFDLCEDEDVSVRKQAIKDLPSLCKENNEYTSKVTDILGQLLQTIDTTELSVVQSSIMTLCKNDIKGALKGMFNLIEISNSPVREKCLKFLVPKIKMLGRDIMTKEMEEYAIDQCKKILRNVTGDEFMQIMDLLAWSRLSQSLAGQKELVEIIKHHAELSKSFDPTNPEDVDRSIFCSLHCVPYLCSAIPSTPFVSFLCEQVLPKLDQIPETPKEESGGLDNQLEALKLLAELSPFYVIHDDTPQHITNIVDCLFALLPTPPTSVEGVEETEPEFKYSRIEALLYTLHHIVKHDVELICKDVDRLKELKKRLQYMARWSMAYVKRLREVLKAGENDADKAAENKVKLVALKTMANINTMVKEFFHNPPAFKATITLSFKPLSEKKSALEESAANGGGVGTKRRAPISFGDRGDRDGVSAAKNRPGVDSKNRIYTPPSGKFSTNLSYQQSREGGGRRPSGGGRGGGGGFRGGFRGGRKWRY